MPVTLTSEEERALLHPMRPDLPGYTVIFDTFLHSTFQQRCFVCTGGIAPGERVRCRFEIRETGERAARLFYACRACCSAMALAAA